VVARYFKMAASSAAARPVFDDIRGHTNEADAGSEQKKDPQKKGATVLLQPSIPREQTRAERKQHNDGPGEIVTHAACLFPNPPTRIITRARHRAISPLSAGGFFRNVLTVDVALYSTGTSMTRTKRLCSIFIVRA
jgi:hypothetical protein